MEVKARGHKNSPTKKTQEHEIDVDGLKLRERKETIHFSRKGESTPYRITLVNTKWIDHEYYKVEEVTEGQDVVYHRQGGVSDKIPKIHVTPTMCA